MGRWSGASLPTLHEIRIDAWVWRSRSSQFLTARAAARHMMKNRRGVILTLSASPARLAIAMTGGFGVACAAVEGLSRTLSAELGPHGVRVVCLRLHRIGETLGEADFPVPGDALGEGVEHSRRHVTEPPTREANEWLASAPVRVAS